MNMKKTLAGLVASIVAVSAMATLSVSAVTVDQKATSGEWDLTTIGQYKAEWLTKYTGSVAAGPANAGTIIASEQKLLTFSAGNVTFDNIKISDVEVVIEGTSAINENSVVKRTAKLNDYGDKLNTTWGIKFNGIKGSQYKGDDVIDINAFDPAKKLLLTVTYKTTTVPSYNSKALAENDSTAATAAVSGTANKSAYTTMVPTFTQETPAGGSAQTGFANLIADGALTITGGVSSLEAGKGVRVSSEGFKVEADTATALNNIPLIGDLDTVIIDALAGTQGSTLTFSFKPGDDSNEGNLLGHDVWLSDTSTNSFQVNLNGNKKFTNAQTLNKKGNDYLDVTFSWDELIKANNYVGLPGVLHTIAVRSAQPVTVTKVSYSVPDKSFVDPSQGEGVTEPEVSIPDAAVTDATTAPATTPDTTNPPTGNAPIALAVIPVAIAAAIVIAKKRG